MEMSSKNKTVQNALNRAVKNSVAKNFIDDDEFEAQLKAVARKFQPLMQKALMDVKAIQKETYDTAIGTYGFANQAIKGLEGIVKWCASTR